jgi:hypothetical protein
MFLDLYFAVLYYMMKPQALALIVQVMTSQISQGDISNVPGFTIRLDQFITCWTTEQ